MHPVCQVLGLALVQELVLHEEGDDPLTKAAAHLLEVDLGALAGLLPAAARGDVDEAALCVEAPLEE